ncbi:olfactory receptor 13H1-like [Heteronotia binoei]|uniref:olfactory receptor 13H1-like n=1 Tax=Heteronotia binoei TaxID=13085 RepID=UPI00292CD914|nr:olfactory receptor 13H1-like [Heteronotia binoei]
MGTPNDTVVTEFILIGLSEHPRAQVVFFWIFLVVYLISTLGNGLMIVLIISDSHLHSPMYFFLCVLSSVDFILSNNAIPEILVNCFFYRPTVSSYRCLVQMYVGLCVVGTECLLLAIMAYDRFAAVCQPLHYMQIMSWRFCTSLVITSMSVSLLNTLLEVLLKPTDFCGQNILNHFACELQSFLRLACSDIHTTELYMKVASFLFLIPPFGFIVLTYVRIGLAVLRIRSTQGRKKAFSTCSSHIAVVSVFYGTIMIMYLKPQEKSASDQDKIISLIYGVLTPTLNPLIYSLRNRDVKEAFWRLFGRKKSE